MVPPVSTSPGPDETITQTERWIKKLMLYFIDWTVLESIELPFFSCKFQIIWSIAECIEVLVDILFLFMFCVFFFGDTPRGHQGQEFSIFFIMALITSYFSSVKSTKMWFSISTTFLQPNQKNCKSGWREQMVRWHSRLYTRSMTHLT